MPKSDNYQTEKNAYYHKNKEQHYAAAYARSQRLREAVETIKAEMT